MDLDKIANSIDNFNFNEYQLTICKNLKTYRLELEKENEAYFKEIGKPNIYSAVNFAELLKISYDHYKRLESEFAITKPISLKLLIKFSILLNKNINDFFIKR